LEKITLKNIKKEKSENSVDIHEVTYLPIKTAGLELHNPFFVGSGPTVKTVDMIEQIDQAGWGAAVIKLTIDPEPYINREPRYRWWSKNKLHTFTAEKRITLDEALRICEKGKKITKVTKILSNITYDGDDGIAGWIRMAKAFEDAGADANELNMCCPNMSFNVEVTGDEIQKCTGASMGKRPDLVAEIVKAIKSETTIPLFVKLTPEGGMIAQVAKAAFMAGADAVSGVGNRLGIPPIDDIENPSGSSQRLQVDPSVTCLSGQWLKPLALRDVYEIRQLNGPLVSVCGYGGMSHWQDYVEMAMLGADMVGMVTETMIRGYNYLWREVRRLKEYMDRNNYGTFKAMRDVLVPKMKTAQTLQLTEAVAYVEEDKCIGCDRCIPIGHCYAIEMIPGVGNKEKNRIGKVALVDPYSCTGCSTCFDICPTDCFVWKPVPKDRVVIPV
jgi:dihydroorotate dehydrogenase